MVPVNTPDVSGREKELLLECIETGWISSEGPFVKQFEEGFSNKVGRKYGVGVANGTAALDIAVRALELPEGSEIILPSFTIISCISSILSSNHIPVVVDSDPVTWNMDVTQIEKAITKKTKAIMVVHIYGLPVDMDPVIELAKKYDLKIIEDAAEMHGQTYKGKPCGSLGDISIFSFYPNKHITTGEGGMLVTDDEKLAEKSAYYRNLCFQAQKRFVHEDIGWNYRMTNMQAALGLAQLERLDDFIVKKRQIGAFYQEALAKYDFLQLPLKKTDYAENIYWVFGIVVKENSPLTKDEIVQQLANKKIGTRPFFWPMHEQPALHKRGLLQNLSLKNSENMARNGFYIPSGLGLSTDDMTEVVQAMQEILGQ